MNPSGGRLRVAAVGLTTRLVPPAFRSVDRSLARHAPATDPSPPFDTLVSATSTRRCLMSVGFVILAFFVGGSLGLLTMALANAARNGE
jgi:hypothetical protein